MFFSTLATLKTRPSIIIALPKLIAQIEDIIRERGWTQQKAADVLGLQQGHVSELMCGHSEKFAVNKLLLLFTRLGKKVSFSIQDAA